LNERSVVLETSRLIGNGTRIPLNLDKLILSGKGYSLFPGQIVGVRGNNPSGRLLNVSEFIYPPLAPVATTQVKRYLELYPSSKEDSKDPLVLMTGCGPFTLPDSLEFEPLEVLLKSVEKTMPDVLILMGPFIDASHPLIVEGLSAHDPRSLFKIKVMDRVKALLQVLPSLQVILVPSTNDLISDWPLLPQPPLGAEVTDAETLKSTEALGLNLPRLLVLPNPVTFLLNEILITISNTDTLVELAGSESGRTEQGSTIKPDRLALFFRHLLQQRHVHPLFPSTHKIHYEHGSPFLMGVRPDLLIIPSLLKPSVKAVEGVLCLNPGTAVKGKVAGTYGRLVVHPLDLSLGLDALADGGGDEELEARIEPRTRVELFKL
jgi:DNA polymerase alpha subunit B